MNPEGELSTEDLARPSGARPDERSDAEIPRDQLPREPGTGGTGLGDQPDYAARQDTEISSPGAAEGDAGTGVTAAGRAAGDVGARDVALLNSADEDRFRQRWADVQARFVDDPQEAVRTADGLVAELMQSLAQGFSDHKGALEAQWQSGGDPDTEELRQALQRYRSFFDRLLST